MLSIQSEVHIIEQAYTEHILMKVQSELSTVEFVFCLTPSARVVKCFCFLDSITVLADAQFANLRAFFTIIHINSEMIFKKKVIYIVSYLNLK